MGAAMSWIEKLYETYEQCAGRPQFASNPLLPIGHTTQQVHVEIVLDSHGGFRRASVVSTEDRTTVVPCTEESGGMVSHPLATSYSTWRETFCISAAKSPPASRILNRIAPTRASPPGPARPMVTPS